MAKTDLFQQVAGDIAAAALAAGAADRLAVLGLEVRPGQTAQELIEEAGATLKEKLELGRYARFEGGYVTSYLHKSDPGPAADAGRARPARRGWRGHRPGHRAPGRGACGRST